ncbi:MAG: hypothetical protein A2Z16_11630 [Chloroflexi bacterium RBG_16_54_18]|nr:MAG: hypothetical protein A2Z16_11630 [Chloroflexi bacterium RBG_16_54_18]
MSGKGDYFPEKQRDFVTLFWKGTRTSPGLNHQGIPWHWKGTSVNSDLQDALRNDSKWFRS